MWRDAPGSAEARIDRGGGCTVAAGVDVGSYCVLWHQAGHVPFFPVVAQGKRCFDGVGYVIGQLAKYGVYVRVELVVHQLLGGVAGIGGEEAGMMPKPRSMPVFTPTSRSMLR